MTIAWVGDHGRDVFSSHVEYSEPSPFCFMNGPRGVSAEEAVAWARAHAERVIVRVGDTRYSAGAEPVEDLPLWPSTDTVEVREATGPTVQWNAEARTGWRRADREDVARRLAELAGQDSRAESVTASLDALGFTITFTVKARSDVEAREIASRVARDAWSASRIDAVPGEDFDISSIEVHIPE